jgi:hypothetical protein
MLNEVAANTTFSIEMTSKQHVKTLTLANDPHTHVLFEGNLGVPLEVSLAEGNVLEVVGAHGVLRIDVSSVHLETALHKHRQTINPGSEVGSPTNTIKQKDVDK